MIQDILMTTFWTIGDVVVEEQEFEHDDQVPYIYVGKN